MNKLILTVPILLVMTVAAGGASARADQNNAPSRQEGFAGSFSCQECHEKFYKLWSTSFHGLAMQPYTPEFAHAKLTPHAEEITIGDFTYRADMSVSTGYVLEKGKAPSESKQFKIEHALGGKNVYYFLTLCPAGNSRNATPFASG